MLSSDALLAYSSFSHLYSSMEWKLECKILEYVVESILVSIIVLRVHCFLCLCPGYGPPGPVHMSMA